MSARPPASSDTVRSRMSRQRRTGTKPELLVRRILHARGIRYRVDTAPEPGLRCKADLVWRGLRLIVFVDGCFWHRCPIHATRPKANAAWWARKLEQNVQRDRRADADLAARGWTVLRFWEHEDPNEVADKICEQLMDLRAGRRM
ncbi:very short patch repair endonuclease [Mycolicibacterium elephantis]|uniref:very short patch repair endonuclease n=1 Tax=Mycolicibacterium elephantis TaxID=81858 RepID=UPI000A02B1D7|nr:very short patch repair endonuclease [Mycolicibacterium elephantis]